MERQSQTFQTRQWPGSRRVLYMSALRCIHREDSAFGVYYQRLVQRGRKSGSALMAVMRKMLAVAAHFLMHEGEEYDRSPVCGSSAGELAGQLARTAPTPGDPSAEHCRHVALKRKEVIFFS